MKHLRANPILLLITGVSLCFGIYGLLFGGILSSPLPAPVLPDDMTEESGTAPGSAPPRAPDATEISSAESTAIEASAAPENAGTAPGAPSQTRMAGRISGFVVDRAGAPVVGANVTAVDRHLRTAAAFDWGASPDEAESNIERALQALRTGRGRVTTDEYGRFEVTGLDPRSRFEVVAASPSHGVARKNDVRCGSEIYLSFRSIGVLNIRVLDDAGNPLTSVKVRTNSGDWESMELRSAADGRYPVELRPLARWVSFSARGYLPSRRFTPADAGMPDLEARLAKACRVTGVVTDRSGKAISGALIKVKSLSPASRHDDTMDTSWAVFEYTDAAGRFEYDSVPPGEYEFHAELTDGGAIPGVAQKVDVSAEHEIQFRLETGARLDVEVLNEKDEPVYLFNASFFNQHNEGLSALDVPGAGPGQQSFIGLPRERVELWIDAEDYSRGKLSVDLSSGASAVTLRLMKGAAVTGRVVAPGGRLIGGVRLRFTEVGKDPGSESDVWAEAEDGIFEEGPLNPGMWMVDVYSNLCLAHKVASQTVLLTGGSSQLDIVVEASRILNIKVEFPPTPSSDWANVYVRLDGEPELQSVLYRPDSNADSTMVLALPAGQFHIYANSQGLCSPITQVNVGEAISQLVLRMKRPDCVMLTRVEPGANAAQSGMKMGDLLVEYDSQPVTSLLELVRLTKLADGREEVRVHVIRGGQKLELTARGGLLGVAAQDAVQ